MVKGTRLSRETAADQKSHTTIPTPDPGVSAGPNGAAIAPPAYGLDVVDRQAAEPGIEPDQARDATQPPVASPPAESGAPAPPPAAPSTPAPAIFEVSEPDDPFEREAEAVAKAVLRSPAPASPPEGDGGQAPPTSRSPGAQTGAIQRRPDRWGLPIWRQGLGAPVVSPATAAVIRNPGPGSPMPTPARRRIEPRLGADLRSVRVHAGSQAQQAAINLQAQAFSRRNHIFLSQPAFSRDVGLMAHEATHVVQQGGAAVLRQPAPLVVSSTPPNVQRLPKFITRRIAGYARHIPGYTLLTVIIGVNPLTGERVSRNAVNLVEGLLGLVPFGTFIFDKLREFGLLQDAFRWIEAELARFDLSLARLEQTFEAAWDDVRLLKGFDYNLQVLKDHFGRLYRDVADFARSLVGHILQLIKDAALDLTEKLLAENRAWALLKKILGQDPLRNTPVAATPVEILEDFLRLIGKEQALEQMRARGTLQETADWLATQFGTFTALLGELRGLFAAAWGAIQPENLPNLTANLRELAGRAGAFLRRVWNFAGTVAAKALALIKKSLLGWLASFATKIPGYHLLTVILGKDVFTQAEVPRTAANLIRGFMSLIPGGEEQFQQMQETGVIPQAAQRIEALLGALGISWPFIRGLFTGIWNSLTLEDLIDPIGAFRRITDQFGEPIGRLFTFVAEVVKIMLELMLAMMNFPTDIIARIISNALQAFENIKRDPVGFLKNMLAAVKLGFSNFFDHILQHLLSGVTDWLFGQLRAAGIEPPGEITLASVLDLVLQILGISVDRIWEKLAKRLGPKNVARIRGAVDRLTGIWTFVRDVQERGIAAIWEYIESQISNLWEMVLEKVRDWIVARIITRVVTKLLSMLDPTGVMAVVNSFIAFFKAIQSAIEYFREMLLIIDNYVTTIASVARGDVEPGAAKLEQGLAGSIPVAIGFLANQVGLGALADKISEIVSGIRVVIDRALDWLLDRAVSLGQAVLGMLGLGGQGKTPAAGDAAEAKGKDSKGKSVSIAAVRYSKAGTALSHAERWKIGVEGVTKAVAKLDKRGISAEIIKAQFPKWQSEFGFKSLTLDTRQTPWVIEGEMSPGKKVTLIHPKPPQELAKIQANINKVMRYAKGKIGVTLDMFDSRLIKQGRSQTRVQEFLFELATIPELRNVIRPRSGTILTRRNVYAPGYNVHHIIPLWLKGTDTPDNFVLLPVELHKQIEHDKSKFLNLIGTGIAAGSEIILYLPDFRGMGAVLRPGDIRFESGSS